MRYLRDQRGVSDSAQVSSVYYDNLGGCSGLFGCLHVQGADCLAWFWAGVHAWLTG